MAQQSLNTRIGTWIKKRNESGQTGLTLTREAIQHIPAHGDWTPLAKLAGHQEQAVAKNVKRIAAAFGLEIVADKKQPSGQRVNKADLLDVNGTEYKAALALLDKAIDAKLSIAGTKLSDAAYFQTDKEAEAITKRKAEKDAAEEAPEETPEAQPIVDQIASLFRQVNNPETRVEILIQLALLNAEMADAADKIVIAAVA